MTVDSEIAQSLFYLSGFLFFIIATYTLIKINILSYKMSQAY